MADDKPDSENLMSDSNTDSIPVPEPTVNVSPDMATAAEAEITFQGNNYDLLSVVGVTVGGLVLLSCATFNNIWCCLPVASIILGAIGLAMAKDSVNPERTRLLSWISLGSGAVILILFILAIIAYIVFIVAIGAAGGEGFYNLN